MRKLASIALLCLALATAGVVAATAEAAPPSATAAVAITPTQSGGVLDGVFQITDFAVNSAGQLVANGVFTGTATIGGITQDLTTTASVILASTDAAGACSILDLVLGPLHLDVLGLVVDLNQVNLDITAQSGPGKLLGNLLCTVTGLLDGNASLNAVQRLLDLLNGLLG
jgi:hypothetical protein